MKLKEKISLEKVFEKVYKDKLVEPKSNKEAVLIHYLHNIHNGVSKYFQQDSLEALENFKIYKQEEEKLLIVAIPPIQDNFLGVPLSVGAFRSNLFVRYSQKGFPVKSLTQNLA